MNPEGAARDQKAQMEEAVRLLPKGEQREE
jgi:hypothetical protein